MDELGVRALKILFFMRAINMDRPFENLLRAMLDRGHAVFCALERERGGLPDDRTHVFDGLAREYPRFSYEHLPRRGEIWLVPATAVRHSLDYLRYLNAEFAHANLLRDRARERAPRLLRLLLVLPPFRWRHGRRFVNWVLRRIEAALPVPRGVRSFITAQAPDVVAVSPLVELGSAQGDYIRAAKGARIPTVHVVASWDNLSSKGVIRDLPTKIIVWNNVQVDEAVALHGVPRERVVAVGAHTFDHWFNWQPALSREEFLTSLGLDPHRKLILYVGSSYFITADETVFIKEWLSHLRSHARLRDVAVILRPHPQNVVGWDDPALDEPGKTIAWPKSGAAPTVVDKKRDYYETLFHSSAVVGVNTSAFLEAAVVRRPTLTLVDDHFATQDGTLHFSYLTGENAPGMLIVGRSWDEHLDQLASAVEAPEAHSERLEAFLTHFVRPLGLDRPAAPAAVDAIELAASEEAVRDRRGRVLRPILWLLTPLIPLLLLILHPVQHVRSAIKALRRASKAVRKRLKNMRRAAVRRKKVAEAQKRDQLKAKTDEEKRALSLKRAEDGAAAAKTREEKEALREQKLAALAEKEAAREAKAKAEAEKAEAEAEKAKAEAEKLDPEKRAAAHAERVRIRAEQRREQRHASGEAAADGQGATSTEGLPMDEAPKIKEPKDKPPKVKEPKDKPPKVKEPKVKEPKDAPPTADTTVEGVYTPDVGASPIQTAQTITKVKAAKDERSEARSKKVVKEGRAPDGASTKGSATTTPKHRRPKRARKPLRKRLRAPAKKLRRGWKIAKRDSRRVYNTRYRFTYRSSITRIPSRDEIPALLNARKLFGRGAEIGVKLAGYSDWLLSHWRGSELISIDPWLSDDPDDYVDRSNVSQDEFEDYYRQACEKLAKYGSRSTVWRTVSVEAAARLPDHSLDFVYIDARHDYASVKEDLEAWYDKVRPGGIFAGHDYVDGEFPNGSFYVKSAVDEFFAARGIPVHGTEGPSAVEMFPSWIVEIPGETRRADLEPPGESPVAPAALEPRDVPAENQQGQSDGRDES